MGIKLGSPDLHPTLLTLLDHGPLIHLLLTKPPPPSEIISFPNYFYLLLIKRIKRFIWLSLFSSSSQNEDLVLGAISKMKTCSHKHDTIIRAVGIFDQFFTFEVFSETSEFGNTICLVGSLPCRKVSKDTDSPDKWTVTCCAGYLVDIGQQLFDYLGFDWTLYITPDNLYGSYTNSSCFNSNFDDLSQCKWNGLINELIKDRADIALGALTPTLQRVQVVDFTESILLTHLTIAYRSTPGELQFLNWKFLQSLDWTLLVSLLVTLVIVCIALFVVEFFMRKVEDSDKYPTREAFSYGAGLTFQRDLAGKTPNRWSARVIAISYAVALTIIMTTYTANLTATNISKAEINFQGLKDEKVCYLKGKTRFPIIEFRAE